MAPIFYLLCGVAYGFDMVGFRHVLYGHVLRALRGSRVVGVMMRFFAFLLAFVSFTALADTIPALMPAQECSWGVWFASGTTRACTTGQLCGKLFGGPEVSHTEGNTSITCLNPEGNSVKTFSMFIDGSPYCPSGYTLNPDKKSCTKPDECPAGQFRSKETGNCISPCPGNQTFKMGTDECECNLNSLNNMAGARPWLDGKGSIPSELCDGSCMRKTGFGLGGGGKYTVEGGAFTGAKCDGVPDKLPEKPPIPNHKPECTPTEGVMTSSSGTVACVPEGTPDGRKPVIKKEIKNETFPDGSTKGTETIKTKDPATGAEDTQTRSTTGPKPDGTAGQAGPVGTGNSSGSKTGTGGGGGGNCQEGENCDDEECDPTLHFCGGPKTEGIYTKKEKTVEGPLQAFASGVRTSLLGTNVTGFFTVNIPSGACPSWSAEVPYLKTRVDISQYMCTAAAVSAMNVVGTVLMVLAAFAAFRWAML